MRYSRLFNPLFSCSFIDPAENFDFNSFRSKHKVSLVSLKISPHALLLLAWSTTHRRFASETASLLTIFLENAPKSGSRSSFGFAHLVSINWSYVPFAAVKQSGSGPTVQSSIFVSFFFSTGVVFVLFATFRRGLLNVFFGENTASSSSSKFTAAVCCRFFLPCLAGERRPRPPFGVPTVLFFRFIADSGGLFGKSNALD